MFYKDIKKSVDSLNYLETRRQISSRIAEIRKIVGICLDIPKVELDKLLNTLESLENKIF